MRQLSNADQIRELMHALGAQADQVTRVYFTGGATLTESNRYSTAIPQFIRPPSAKQWKPFCATFVQMLKTKEKM